MGKEFGAIAIGVSAGGIEALEVVLTALPKDFKKTIIIVQHISAGSDGYLAKHFDMICALPVLEVEDKMSINSGTIYFAPSNYHLLVERKKTFALSSQAPVKYSRPSIDVMMETVAEAYHKNLIGIILTGANSDGSDGIEKIKKYGGMTIAQSPETAMVKTMPEAAIATGAIDYIVPLNKISELLIAHN